MEELIDFRRCSRQCGNWTRICVINVLPLVMGILKGQMIASPGRLYWLDHRHGLRNMAFCYLPDIFWVRNASKANNSQSCLRNTFLNGNNRSCLWGYCLTAVCNIGKLLHKEHQIHILTLGRQDSLLLPAWIIWMIIAEDAETSLLSSISQLVHPAVWILSLNARFQGRRSFPETSWALAWKCWDWCLWERGNKG